MKKIVYEFRNNIERDRREEKEGELVWRQKRSGVNLMGIYVRRLMRKQTDELWGRV